MASDVVVTKEIPPLPERADDAHKGEVGRVAVIGGAYGELTMVGAPAMSANAALRGGAGLVRIWVPQEIILPVSVLAPCATIHTLSSSTAAIIKSLAEFQADVVVLGPGLGMTLSPAVAADIIRQFPGPLVVDADGLNRLAEAKLVDFPKPQRIVMTPHVGEADRLLKSRGHSKAIGRTRTSRSDAALALSQAYGCAVVLKGAGTVVTHGARLYVNETGNSGMATAGSGDVLTGLIAALIGQGMEPFEAAILGVYLHGLAGDFAAEELGRRSLTANDLIEFLPEAMTEHILAAAD